jgi:tetratricopeptide (TPR) repeat protein
MDTNQMNSSGELNNSQKLSRDVFMGRSVLDFEKDDKLLKDLPEDSSRIQGQGHYRLAKLYYDKSDLLKAEEYFLKALEMSEFPRDTFAIFKTYGFLIRIYSQTLNEREAEKYISLSEKILEEYSKNAGSLNAEYFYNQGVVSSYRGEFERAKENFQMSYKKSQEENEPELVSKSLFSLATALFNLGEFKESLLFLSQLTELLLILKKDYLKGSMHILHARINTELNNFKEALTSYDEALRTLQKKSCWNLYCSILVGKGIVYKKMGEFDKALIYFNLAKNSTVETVFRKLAQEITEQVEDVNDSSVDLYLDRHNRVIHEKSLGTIDFKHRFVLLEILFLLARNSGTHFNKEDLAKAIWKDEYNPLIHDKLIYTSISRLRKLIEPKDGKRKYILRGKDGYTFNPRINARFHKEHDVKAHRTIGNVEINQPV